MKFSDPREFSEWLAPHSVEWYKQLEEMQGSYIYPWLSTKTEPNGETIFDEEVTASVKGKKVLDVGCGHGEFTKQCGSLAKEIVGFDVTGGFIEKAKEQAPLNVSFVIGNSKRGMPFETGEFGFAYNRKGPTSAYRDLQRVVKKGGNIIGLHPGDSLGQELASLFPGLFSGIKGTPVMDNLKQRLDFIPFAGCAIEEVNSTEYLETPLDVIKYRCFGQSPKVHNRLMKRDLPEIEKIFKENAVREGLAVTFSRYLVRVTV